MTSLSPEARQVPRKPRKTVTLFGLPFDAVTLAETVDIVRHACLTRERLFMTTANVNFVVVAQKDEAFRQSIFDSDLCVADGMPIVWTCRLLGLPLPERVAGADVFEALRGHPDAAISVYFFGGPAGVGERSCAVLNGEQGGVRCVGFQSPGFGTVESLSTQEHIDHINAANPEFVIVALGAHKGQAWIQRNRLRLDAPVISHLGAVVNFVGGRVRRAPMWMRRIGLEWLWRVREEPTLFRRYAKDALGLVRLLVLEFARGRRRRTQRDS